MFLFLLACDAAVPPTGVDTAGDSAPPDVPDSGGDSSSGDIDTAPDTAASACAGAPVVTWNSFGDGFMRENCQGCHASTAPDRHGAPEAYAFDTVEDAWRHAERVLARSAGADATMPPQGGVSEDDRTRLVWWLQCGTPGT
jgi:mono/diheme cytochrome c family protein